MDRPLRLITGGTGFIGSNLLGDLKISSADCNLQEQSETNEFLGKSQITEIVHCAAKHGSFSQMQSNHTEYLSKNLLIDTNVIGTAAKIGIENLIAVSSVSTLAENGNNELNESNLESTKITTSNFGYNASKRYSIDICRAINLDYGYNYKSVLLGNVYGPRDHFVKEGTVVASIISQMINAKNSGLDLVLFGTGKDLRTFTYVEDLNPALDFLMKSGDVSPTIISSGFHCSISELASYIKEELNFVGKIIFSEQQSDKKSIKVTSNQKLKLMGYTEKWTSIQEGIHKTVQWFLENG
jgi:GDP-L-fucose synthase